MNEQKDPELAWYAVPLVLVFLLLMGPLLMWLGQAGCGGLGAQMYLDSSTKIAAHNT